MKSMQNYRRVLLGISLILLSTTMIFQCTQSNERADREVEREVTMTDEQYEERRTRLESDINGELDEVNRELDRLGQRLEDAEGDTRVEIERTRDDLRRERDELNNSLQEVRNSTRDEWENVEREVNEGLEETRNALKDVGNRIEKLFESDVDVEIDTDGNS